MTEDQALGPRHHHHAPDGSISIEHRHHLLFEGRLGVEDDPRYTGPLNCPPLHEHFEPIEGERCDDPECPMRAVEVAS